MIIATSTVQVLDVSLDEVGIEQQLMRIAPTCSSVQVTSRPSGPNLDILLVQ